MVSTVDSSGALGQPKAWTGRSGRRYTHDSREDSRSGGMASILCVQAEGAASEPGAPAEGTTLALKLASTDQLARETMAREVETFELLQAARVPPCPRMVDVVDANGEPVGIIMEWCPTDMEQWWDRILVLPDAMEPLCGALADVCRRIAEYHAIMASKGVRAVHADIKPRNAVLGQDGRWLLTDFGAAKSRPIEQETWEATRLILGTENFIAPEMLFNARKQHPQAMDTWSVGATFFALLKMRRHRLYGHELPIDGTHSIQFRCQRMSWVTDLREREPTLFAGKNLDAAAFSSPDRLPDEDRSVVSQALMGVFGEPDSKREQQLEQEILTLLDRALAIDPAKRFTRAEDMSKAFDHIVRRYWELEGSLNTLEISPDEAAARSENMPMQHEPDLDEGRPTVVASEEDRLEGSPPMPSPVAPVEFARAGQADEQTVLASDVQRMEALEGGDGRVPPLEPAPSLGPPPSGDVAPAPSFPTDTLVPPMEPLGSAGPGPETTPPDDRVVRLLEGIHAQLGKQRTTPPAGKLRLPFWLVLAIGLLIFCQALQFGLLVAIFLGGMGLSSPTLDRPDDAGIAADLDGASPFEPTAPVEDGLADASADPERSGDEPLEDQDGVAPEDGEDPTAIEQPEAEVVAEPADEVEIAEAPAPAPIVEPEPEPVEPEPAPAPKPVSKPAPTPTADVYDRTSTTTRSSSGGGTQRSSSAGSSAPAAAEPAAASGTASIEVFGATSYVVGSEGRRPTGELPTGTYEVFAQPNDSGDYFSLGVHMLSDGEKMQFRCGFGACRQIQ